MPVSVISSSDFNYRPIGHSLAVESRHMLRRRPLDALQAQDAAPPPTPVLDQSQLIATGLAGPGNFTVVPSSMWQSFTAGMTGTLTRIDFGVTYSAFLGGVQLIVHDGQGISGQILQSTSMFVPLVANLGVGHYQFVSGTVSVPIVSGHQYTFELKNYVGQIVTLDRNDIIDFAITSGSVYQGGVFGFDGGTRPVDLVFQTFVEVRRLWTEDADSIDFSQYSPADYTGPYDNALGGNDIVVLPHDGGGLLAWGLSGGLFHGGAGNDTINGSSSAGAYVNPILFGDDGNDHLYGGTGDDQLEGGAGDDHLYQGPGSADDHVSDRLVGDAGQDTFHVGAGDIVADLEIGEHIVLEGDLATGAIAGVFAEGADAQGHHYSVQIAVATADGMQTVSGAEFISATALNFRLEGPRTLVAVQPAAPALPDDWAANLEQDATALIPGKLADLRDMLFDTATNQAKQGALDHLTALAVAKLNNTAAIGLSTNDVFRLLTHEFDQLQRASIGFGPVATIAQKLFIGVPFVQAFTGMVTAQLRYYAGITTQAEERVEFAKAVKPLGFGLIEGFQLVAVSSELLTLLGVKYAAGLAQFISSLVDDYGAAITQASPGGDFQGTGVHDVLIGTHGDDRFTSSAGSDFYVGNGGTDTLDYSNAASGIAADLAAGTVRRGPPPGQLTDLALGRAQAAAESSTDAVSGIANLVGSHFDDSLAGDGAANRLAGGLGNDIYVVDALDAVVEAAGQGMDTVYATQSFALGAGVEVELLSVSDGAATVAINLTGNEYGQTIIGNAGNNFLIAGGGADGLYGGLGDDTYSVDTLDAVIDAGGFDIIYSSTNYALNAGAEIEILSANDFSLTTALNLAGNDYGQSIFGNAGNNFLIAGGGADGLYGGLGNDTYSVDTLDVVIDTGGFDIIYSSTNFQLNAGAEIEILSASDFAATTPLNLTGNERDQQIFGNAGNNFLIAGAGADGLYGKGGNDTYSIDSNDVVVENAGEGYDTLYTSTSFILGAGTEIEVISASDFAATTAINLTGNEFGQQILGNAGANVLNGRLGADSLGGGGGADIFAFTTALGATNVDTILDFASGTDKVALDHAIFTALGVGPLSAGAFIVGTAAGDADDRLVYNSATGQLLYDADGNGGGAAVQFATLGTGLALAASDFVVI